MKTIKIIDLLNKMANGEEVPKEIKWNYEEWEYIKEVKDYYSFDRHEHLFNTVFPNDGLGEFLNDEVEIIEEEKQEDDFTGVKWFTRGNEVASFRYDEPEEKEIEKLDYCEENTFSNMKECTHLSPKERRLLDSNFKSIKEKFDELIDAVNEIRKEK